jgi:hypothetical protein
MTWIDLSFAIFFNLVTDTYSKDPPTHVFGKVSSFVLLFTLLFYYYKLIVLTQINPKQLSDFETEIIMDKLNTDQVLKHKQLRNVNLEFKVKIILIMGVIVGLQNTPYACVATIAVI